MIVVVMAVVAADGGGVGVMRGEGAEDGASWLWSCLRWWWRGRYW